MIMIIFFQKMEQKKDLNSYYEVLIITCENSNNRCEAIWLTTTFIATAACQAKAGSRAAKATATYCDILWQLASSQAQQNGACASSSSTSCDYDGDDRSRRDYHRLRQAEEAAAAFKSPLNRISPTARFMEPGSTWHLYGPCWPCCNSYSLSPHRTTRVH